MTDKQRLRNHRRMFPHLWRMYSQLRYYLDREKNIMLVRAYQATLRGRKAKRAADKRYSKTEHGREIILKNVRNHNRKLRKIVLRHYCRGTPCCMEKGCKVTCVEILELDHTLGGGCEHKRKVGRSGEFYRWIIRNNFPKMFKVRCPNCHRARHRKVRWF